MTICQFALFAWLPSTCDLDSGNPCPERGIGKWSPVHLKRLRRSQTIAVCILLPCPIVNAVLRQRCSGTTGMFPLSPRMRCVQQSRKEEFPKRRAVRWLGFIRQAGRYFAGRLLHVSRLRVHSAREVSYSAYACVDSSSSSSSGSGAFLAVVGKINGRSVDVLTVFCAC